MTIRHVRQLTLAVASALALAFAVPAHAVPAATEKCHCEKGGKGCICKKGECTCPNCAAKVAEGEKKDCGCPKTACTCKDGCKCHEKKPAPKGV